MAYSAIYGVHIICSNKREVCTTSVLQLAKAEA